MRWPRLPRRRRGEREPAGHARDRARMVAEQLEARGIRDTELLRAFATVERHAFVAGDEPYGDHAMPVGSGQTISQPYVVASMTARARPPDGWAGAPVLEVGTGSGYQAAILAEMGARVTSIERHEDLAEGARQRLRRAGYGDRVEVVVGDGTLGWPAGAPYRSVLVTAAGPSVPGPLLEQLDSSGGRMVMPVGSREHQMLTLIVREGSELTSMELEPVVFVPLIGAHGFQGE
ncbi:MAG TPA: protein-L-isoaspartate(D-aspartate) O-methyltransferase [Methylomirabilota bacterium]|nr:protein-L-isoaspartate(D-aspartate) O-methyltransferase [Methylomirabilota bacterium]